MEYNISANKERAVSFLNLIVSNQVAKAFEEHAGTDFVHHNPFFQGDAVSLKKAMEENGFENPDKVIEVKRAIQEGDTVVVHSHIKQTPEDRGAAVVHIFRFQEDRIVELWDAGQAIPEDSPNENGVF
ncbi:nuclear transport factor 2 family protein [Bacillus sp. P14.5]|uniref:nuclear transport factor 2 family protein n=1 Tax=Bacillus sp. P14.5 TaxID=1983400 RepID=UPI000DE8557E|nr:nuclear transport factor 2 family protein [Bacillus sp. P14.5]